LLVLAATVVVAQASAPPAKNDATSSALSSVTVQISPEASAERLQQTAEPEYPTKALNAGVQGVVVLKVLIGKNGKVKEVNVTSGDPILAKAAVNAVKHWRREPWASGGNNTESLTTVTVHFAISDGPTDCPGQESAKYLFLSESAAHRSRQATSEDQEHTVFHVGPSVKAPRPIFAPDPEYSESARRHEQQGIGVLRAIVTADGRVARVKVERVIGFGLDQNAVNAVCQ